MVEIIKAEAERLEDILALRREMLAAVNGVPEDSFGGEFTEYSREYFSSGDQTTVLALDGGKAVGCATICYVSLMPTFSHPTGRRAHIMNVYTRQEYRKQGVAGQMLNILLEEARERGVTYVDLDASDIGKPLYETLGLAPSEEYMGLSLLPEAAREK